MISNDTIDLQDLWVLYKDFSNNGELARVFELTIKMFKGEINRFSGDIDR